MKKFIVMVLLSVIILSGRVYAQESNWEFGGGIIYNTYSLDEFNEHIRNQNNHHNYNLFWGLEDITSPMKTMDGGFGYFINGRYPIDEKVSLGGEFQRDSMNTSYTLRALSYSEQYNLSLTSLLGTMDYKVGLDNANLYFQGGVGPYFSSLDWGKRVDYHDDDVDIKGNYSDSFGGTTIGFRVGTGIELFINDKVSLLGKANYRYVKFDNLEDGNGDGFASLYKGELLRECEFDFSGFGFGASIDIKF